MKDEKLENAVVTLHCSGWSIRRLAAQFAVSRKRIKRIIDQNRQQRDTGENHNTRAPKPSKLDPYKAYIAELLESYKNPPPTVQRVFEMICAKGYQGGKTIVSYHLAGIRGKKAPEAVVCVETAAGQRGSHDWSEYYITFTSSGKQEKVIFFSFILNYSRRQYIEIVPDKTQNTMMQCLINAFIYLDGVPHEVKSDNQKACVDRWEYGRAVFNRTYLEFATHYRFTPLAIHPGKPRENLKIERPFYYLEKNFLNTRSFIDVTDLQEQLAKWLLDVNDQRVHRTTRQKPVELYRQEYTCLQPLPLTHFDTSVTAYRIVNNESCIQWKGYFYAVPDKYMYATCLVRENNQQLIIYGLSMGEIIRYPVAEKGCTNRYVGRTRNNVKRTYLQTKEVITRLEAMGPTLMEYVAQVKKQKANSYRHHLRSVLSLKVHYHTPDIIRAVNRALRYKVYESSAIENFLALNAEKKSSMT